VTVGAWLAERTPAPPQALRERVGERLGRDADVSMERASEVCAASGARTVQALVSTDCSARHHAIDLLAADALITYAIEHAAEHSADFASEMERLIARVAAVGSGS
jgi:hypothetical protein